MLVMAVALMSALHAIAQNVKIADKEIVGAWYMESMQWEGEKKTMCGKATAPLRCENVTGLTFS